MLTLRRPQILWRAALHRDVRYGTCVEILHGAGVHGAARVHWAATDKQTVLGDCDLGLLPHKGVITPPAFLSHLLHSYTLSLWTKPSLPPPVSPHWQRALIFQHTESSTSRTCEIKFTPIRPDTEIQCKTCWQLTAWFSYASDFLSLARLLWNRHNEVKLQRT
jgi:hypothetical protein